MMSGVAMVVILLHSCLSCLASFLFSFFPTVTNSSASSVFRLLTLIFHRFHFVIPKYLQSFSNIYYLFPSCFFFSGTWSFFDDCTITTLFDLEMMNRNNHLIIIIFYLLI